jgi:hypothetical protein
MRKSKEAKLLLLDEKPDKKIFYHIYIEVEDFVGVAAFIKIILINIVSIFLIPFGWIYPLILVSGFVIHYIHQSSKNGLHPMLPFISSILMMLSVVVNLIHLILYLF